MVHGNFLKNYPVSNNKGYGKNKYQHMVIINIRDWLFVDDHIEALLLVIKFVKKDLTIVLGQ